MRSLAQPKVLARAGLAALLTSLACLPRLAAWPQRPEAVSLLWLTLLWAMFVMWAFVFAWQFQYAHRPAISLDFQPRLWGAATLCALAAALLARFLFDPRLRLITPGDYPTNIHSWLVMGLFSLAFEPLFLCFAPFALFIRLSRRPDTALVLTVLLGIFILGLKIGSAKTLPPISLVVELMVLHVAAGFVWVYFYVKGGALVVWWMGLIVHLRLLADLMWVR